MWSQGLQVHSGQSPGLPAEPPTAGLGRDLGEVSVHPSELILREDEANPAMHKKPRRRRQRRTASRHCGPATCLTDSARPRAQGLRQEGRRCGRDTASACGPGRLSLRSPAAGSEVGPPPSAPVAAGPLSRIAPAPFSCLVLRPRLQSPTPPPGSQRSGASWDRGPSRPGGGGGRPGGAEREPRQATATHCKDNSFP